MKLSLYVEEDRIGFFWGGGGGIIRPERGQSASWQWPLEYVYKQKPTSSTIGSNMSY